MTKEQAIESLKETKLFTDGKEKELLEKLFKLGFRWAGTERKEYKEEFTFLFIYFNGTFTYSFEYSTFRKHEHREITADYILNLTWDEECEFKPFDKVLVRDKTEDKWIPCFFRRKHNDKLCPYEMIGGCVYTFCIPYEGNEDLAFTTNEPKK